MYAIIFLFLNIIFSSQAMEVEQPNMWWVSAKLLYAFLPQSEFKKLGKQVFDGGKDGKWGTIDLKFSSLVDRMHQTLPKYLLAIIYDFYDAHNDKDKQRQQEDDKDLINQSYVNSYAVCATFPQNTWEKSDYQYSFSRDIYTIPYDNEQEKILEIKCKEGDGFKAKIITAKHPEIQRPNCINKNALSWVQEKDVCFAVYDCNDEKSIECTDLSTNKVCKVPLKSDYIWLGTRIVSIKDLKLDYKRNLLFYLIVIGNLGYNRFGYPGYNYHNCIGAYSYKKENQKLTFNKTRKIENFNSDTYMKNYDNNSGLCYTNNHISYANPKNNIITFVDIFTGKWFEQEYNQSQNGKSFYTSSFDSDIGIFAVDDNERTAHIFKPRLNYEIMETFIKTMTLYDRMLVHAVLKEGGFTKQENNK